MSPSVTSLPSSKPVLGSVGVPVETGTGFGDAAVAVDVAFVGVAEPVT
jgi:hypothetical protein